MDDRQPGENHRPSCCK